MMKIMKGLGKPPDDRRCTWITVPPDTRCQNWIWQEHAADRLCRKHHEQARIEAENRRANEVAVRLEVDVTPFDGDVFGALNDKLARLNAKVAHFDRVVTDLLDGGIRYRSKGGAEQIRGEWRMLMEATAEIRKTADVIVRAGIAHRLAEIRANEAERSQATVGREELEDMLDAVPNAFADAVGATVAALPVMYGEDDISSPDSTHLTPVTWWSEGGRPGIPRTLLMPLSDRLREQFRSSLPRFIGQARRQRTVISVPRLED